jgi:hypothetical protein
MFMLILGYSCLVANFGVQGFGAILFVILGVSFGLEVGNGYTNIGRHSISIMLIFIPFVIVHHSGILNTLLVGITSVIIIYFINIVGDACNRLRWRGTYLLGLTSTTIVACLACPIFFASLGTWEQSGALILFLGLLPLINAPFDWASLGLTRALLHRGLELGGWWPFLFALFDAVAAVAVISMLALIMVLIVQAFDALAVSGGGRAILSLDKLFDGIAAFPDAPEFWWVYAMLLSTMIPSLLNLMIGGASLVRGAPWLPSLLLPFIPEGKVVLRWDRHWIAAVLTAQVVIGVILGILAQVAVVVVMIEYFMPWIGTDLLGMAHLIAAFDLPAKLGL